MEIPEGVIDLVKISAPFVVAACTGYLRMFIRSEIRSERDEFSKVLQANILADLRGEFPDKNIVESHYREVDRRLSVLEHRPWTHDVVPG